MPNAVDKDPAAPGSLQGLDHTFANDAERRKAIDDAFDYRGDVTLRLCSGETVEGFLSNRSADAKPPVLQLFVKGEDVPRTLPYADVAGLSFSGRDTADGKSYQAWKDKKHGERSAEAQQVEEEMRKQGYL